MLARAGTGWGRAPRRRSSCCCSWKRASLGALTAFDLVLFFVFWEAMLIPMYLLIGLLGGERRDRRGAQVLHLHERSAACSCWWRSSRSGLTVQQPGRPAHLRPARPRPDADARRRRRRASSWPSRSPSRSRCRSSRSTPGCRTRTRRRRCTALVLGTMLVKVGAYGFLRFGFPLFPAASMRSSRRWHLDCWRSSASSTAGSPRSAQRDIVRLIAFTSIAHLGFVVLGIFAFNKQGIQGSVLQMVNHGDQHRRAVPDGDGADRPLAAAGEIAGIGGFGGPLPDLLRRLPGRRSSRRSACPASTASSASS